MRSVIALLPRCLLIVLAMASIATARPVAAQNAGSNTTGSNGLIAVDKVGNKLRFYDPATLSELKVLDSPGPTVHELAMSYDHRTAWVPLYGDGIYGHNEHKNHVVLVVDLIRREITGQIDTAPCLGPHGLAATRAARLWVVCDNNKLIEIDTASQRVAAAYDAPALGTHFLVLLPDESRLYIASKEDDLISFDLKTRRFGGHVSLRAADRARGTGNGSGCEGLTPTPDGKRILVFDNDQGDLHVIDTVTEREIDRVSMQLSPPTNARRSRLHKLMFSPGGKYLLAVDYVSGLVWIINPQNLREQWPLVVAKGPQGIAYAPDGTTALISNHDEGLITIIDLAHHKIVGAVDGGEGIESLAYY